MKPTVLLAKSLTPDGESLYLHEHDGHFFLKVGGVQLMGTNASLSEKEMADLACVRLPKRPRILIGGLGFGFTLKRVLELCPEDAVVDVAELLQIVIDWNIEFLKSVNGQLLDDPRVHIHVRDVAELISKAKQNGYDAILLDVDNSPDPFVQQDNAKLYDNSGLLKTKAALNPGGRVVFWSAHPDRSFTKSLAKHFHNVEAVSAKAYSQAKRFTHTLFIGDRDPH